MELDPENIEQLNIEESDTDSRKSLIVDEESGENRFRAEQKTFCRYISPIAIIWKILKTVVFSLCLTNVVFQTIDFYHIYSEYPTNLIQRSTLLDEIKLPAVTLCFKNMVSTKQFCDDNPDWCERPNNLEGFCKNHPIHCKGDISKLTIPMTGYYTNKSRNLDEITKIYLINDEFDDPFVYKRYISNKETRTFIPDGGPIYKCYSDNLHTYQSGSKLQTHKSNIYTNYRYGNRSLELYRIELFARPGAAQVFLGVHSPFDPIDPLDRGHAIRSGYSYNIEVKLEKEEHLMPPPYQTNCKDNGPSKNVKNFTYPNSYEGLLTMLYRSQNLKTKLIALQPDNMCLQICLSELTKVLFGCATSSLTMSLSPDFCAPKVSKSYDRGPLNDKYMSCLANCKPGCLILHYKYKIEEIKHPANQDIGIADIEIVFRNRKVILESHVPLYGSGELVSHVGGLLGYWLGISVFNSLHIVEKFFKIVMIGWKRIRKNKEQETST